MMKHSLVIILLLGILAGCSLTPNQTTQITTEQPAISTATVSTTAVSTAAIGTASTDYFLPDPTVGLDRLKSYAIDLTISFTGTRDGVDFNYTDTYHQDVNLENNAEFTYSSITNPEGSLEEYVAGNMEDAYYSKSGDGECKVSWGKRAEGYQQLNPAKMLPPLLAVIKSDPEVINGIQTDHYLLDDKSLAYPSSTNVEGQVWLSQEGGYIMKYLLLIQDEGGFFGDGVKGQQEFTYELSQINALAGPDLPQGCQAVLTSIPTSDDAFDLQRLPGVLAYSSPSAMTQIESFYEQQLPDLGWVLSSSTQLSSDACTMIFLNAEESQTAYISLQVEDANTWVTVKVEATEDISTNIYP
jgi:hypothetical protein